jgi:hypothetical protein
MQADAPAQSSAMPANCSPSACASSAATGRRLSRVRISSAGSLPGCGRPRWLATTTRAPRAASSRSVGSAASMRARSATLPSRASGTLRSARTSTRCPRQSCVAMSSSGASSRLITCASGGGASGGAAIAQKGAENRARRQRR